MFPLALDIKKNTKNLELKTRFLHFNDVFNGEIVRMFKNDEWVDQMGVTETKVTSEQSENHHRYPIYVFPLALDIKKNQKNLEF